MFFEQRSLKLSAGLHIGLLLIAAFGLPALLPDAPEIQPTVITVDILPIAERSNVRPSDKPIQKAQKAPSKTPPKPVPPKPKPAAPKPQPKPPEPVEEEKPFDPNEGAEPQKPKPPKEVKPKTEPKQETDEFDKLLNDLEKTAEKSEKEAKDQTTQEENRTQSNAPFDETLPLALSEQDALNSAFIPCWSPPAGAKDAANLIVVVLAQYTPDGRLIDAKLDPKQQGRYNSDSFFRAAADSALRATRMPNCNPLKNLPASLYPKLKYTKINFDPRVMAQ